MNKEVHNKLYLPTRYLSRTEMKLDEPIKIQVNFPATKSLSYKIEMLSDWIGDMSNCLDGVMCSSRNHHWATPGSSMEHVLPKKTLICRKFFSSKKVEIKTYE